MRPERGIIYRVRSTVYSRTVYGRKHPLGCPASRQGVHAYREPPSILHDQVHDRCMHFALHALPSRTLDGREICHAFHVPFFPDVTTVTSAVAWATLCCMWRPGPIAILSVSTYPDVGDPHAIRYESTYSGRWTRPAMTCSTMIWSSDPIHLCGAVRTAADWLSLRPLAFNYSQPGSITQDAVCPRRGSMVMDPDGSVRTTCAWRREGFVEIVGSWEMIPSKRLAGQRKPGSRILRGTTFSVFITVPDPLFPRAEQVGSSRCWTAWSTLGALVLALRPSNGDPLSATAGTRVRTDRGCPVAQSRCALDRSGPAVDPLLPATGRPGVTFISPQSLSDAPDEARWPGPGPLEPTRRSPMLVLSTGLPALA